ncbi:MAG: plastocyanin/azurin family copper-binding protein [Thaumarchaeota archaeon]|nr:plastocyanin/azurin family copper-binding protein [Nitrososphaerota archaeon]
MVAVVAIAGLGAYVAFAPSGPATTTPTSSTTSTSSTSSSASSVTVTLAPPSPMVSPGETQNYSLVEVSVAGSGTGGTLNLEAFPPNGLSLVFNQTSVPLSGGTQSVPVVLKAAAGLSPGNYSVTIETTSSAVAATNQTFTVQVVPMLVIMQDFAFHPQNITVTSGTRVTWLNLDSNIGCCDPGEHDVSFSSGANETSPLLSTFQSWSYTFGSDGVYGYYCTIHLFMKGQVTVTG